MPKVNTIPRGTGGQGNARDQIMSDIRVNVSAVVVPVTVKDSAGHLVEGLLQKDFAVYENDVPQQITWFTSDPFPLSIAVLVDTGMSERSLKKVKAGLDALSGAFAPTDQVAIYTYSATPQKLLDFSAAGDQLSAALRKVEERRGNEGGIAVAGGPMNAGPSVNGHPFDLGQAPSHIIPKETRAMNDAILAAALDLAQTDKTRRRVMLIISDGKESNSTASYSDVLKVLLSHQITVYAVGVDAASLPIYRKLETVNVPGTGSGNILPKYASATGGEFFPEFTRNAIESAYASVTEDARNQYTLEYKTRPTLAENYREIDVRVHRPGLKVRARAGYYPLPERP